MPGLLLLVAGETVTVDELIGYLETLPGGTVVFHHDDSGSAPVEPAEIEYDRHRGEVIL